VLNRPTDEDIHVYHQCHHSFKVHIVGRSGVDSYLVLVVSGYGTLGPELVRGGGWGRRGGGGVGRVYLFILLP